MTPVICTTLTSSQRTAIESLIHACSAHDRIRLSFPFDDGDLFVFLYEEHSLPHDAPLSVSAAAAFSFCGPDSWDCAAFTHPSFRGRGAFSALLEAGLSRLPRESSIFFYVDPACRDTMAVLSALHAEHLADEHMLELSPENFSKFISIEESSGSLTVVEVPGGSCRTLHITIPNGEVFIHCHASHHYLYGLEIAPAHRGRGLGGFLLAQALSVLFLREPKPVRLQVSGDNVAALSLYKKTGFRITETLSCYLF